MDPHWDEKSVFLQALGLPPEQRERFLGEACQDETQKERIESLLRHHAKAPEEFMAEFASITAEEAKQPDRIGEFKIIHRLGEGGMGTVYLAEDTVLGRKVALKVLGRHLAGSLQALARFREEARSTAALKHRGIVPVYKFGKDGDDHYLVTEYVEGRTLAQMIEEKRKSLSATNLQDVRDWHRQAAGIVVAIADALDCAHREKIVHRDVKPSNILVDRGGHPRLTDFGIAKHLAEENRTQHTALIGSCHYMSPEQADIANTRIDQRSDIFSLGVVMYELLSLQKPFDGPSLHSVLSAVMECNPPRLRSVDRRIPSDLDTICHKAIEREPKDRYPTAAHIAADLRSFAAGEHILARPPSIARRIRQVIRNNRKYVTVLAGAAIVLLIVGIWYQAHAFRGRQQSRVSLSCPTSDSDVELVICYFDGMTIGKVANMGVLPREVSLPVGQYRFVAKRSDSEFSEASLHIARAGQALELVLPIPAYFEPSNEMVSFQGGSYICGEETRDGAQAARSVVLEPFHIDRTEVSNAEYKRFLDATGYPAPRHWRRVTERTDLIDHPVVGVSWEDANAYCRFVNKRLPTANEWECAMRYPDRRVLPWGDQTPSGLLTCTPETIARSEKGDWEINFVEYAKLTRPVMSQEELSSSLGLYHGATNVSELTENFETDNRMILKGAHYCDVPEVHDLVTIENLPYDSLDRLASEKSVVRVYRPKWSMKIGFRCARSAAAIRSN